MSYGHKISRRELLRIGIVSGLGRCALGSASAQPQLPGLGTMIGGVSLGTKQITRSMIVIAALDERRLLTHDLPFHCHSVTYLPRQKHLALGVERLGKNAALVDTSNGKVVKKYNSPAGRTLYGHCTFSRDGRTAYLPAVLDHEKGYIPIQRAIVLALDLERSEFLLESKVLGLGPHDIKMLPDDQTLAVPIGWKKGGRSALTFIDRATLKERTSQSVGSLDLGALTHLALAANNTIIATANHSYDKLIKTGNLHIMRGNDSGFERILIPPEIHGLRESHLLSICVSHSGETLAATCPAHDRVFFFNTLEKRLVAEFKTKVPTGVSLSSSKDHFVIAGLDGFRFINTTTLKEHEKFHWHVPLVDQSIFEFYRHADCA